MKRIDLQCAESGKRLDAFIADNSEITRSHAHKLIADGMVTVNGATVTKPAQIVAAGAKVCFTLPDEVALNIESQDLALDIVYQDADLAVINKPQGMTVHPANNVYRDTLVNALLYHIKDLSGINGVLRPGIVHRLDKDTSGLLVIAKNDCAHVNLQKQIQSKQCRRIYVALLEGVVKQDDGVIDQPIGRSRSDRKKMDVVPDGRSAVTYYTVLERFDRYTLVQFELKTGRTHQIRVHAKFLGHPVVGDKTYGYSKCKWQLDGQLLHAAQLTFNHPVTGKEMTFTAPLPDYFDKVLQSLRSRQK